MKVIIIVALLISLGCSTEEEIATRAENCELLLVNYIGLLQMYDDEVIRKHVPELVPDMLSLLEEHRLTYEEHCWMTGPLPPLYIHTGHTI